MGEWAVVHRLITIRQDSKLKTNLLSEKQYIWVYLLLLLLTIDHTHFTLAANNNYQ